MFNIDSSRRFENRYDPAKFMRFNEGMFDILDSKFMDELSKLSRYGIFNVTVEEGNPSLISELIYGKGYYHYWWILMVFNNITNPAEIKNGLVLKYPSIEDLENIYFSLVPE